jgi:hypothetical protein
MLPGSRILADDEFPIRNPFGKGWAHPLGCLLGLGLVNRRIAMRPRLFCARKHAPSVGPHLAGEELIDGCPAASRSGFINNRAGIIVRPSQAEAAISVDMPIRAERRKQSVSRKFAHRYPVCVEAQCKVKGVLRTAGANNRHDRLSAPRNSMKRDAVISRHALQQTIGISH